MKQKMISRIGALFLTGSMFFTSVELPELVKAAESGATEKVKTTDEIIGNDEAGIPDENLYSLVLYNADSNKDRKLQKSEAESCTSLEFYAMQFSNLKGIEFFSNLESLTLNGASLTDEICRNSGLSELKKIKKLNLSANDISDISFVSELSNLRELDLENNNIYNIDALSNLKKLETLNLARNEIQSISSIAELKKLKNLNLGFTGYLNTDTDLKYLSGLTALENLKISFRCLDNNSLQYLSGLTNLKSLNLDECDEIKDISLLSNLTNLEELSIDTHFQVAQRVSIRPLAELKKLKKLNLCEFEVKDNDYSALFGLTELEDLNLSCTADWSYETELRKLPDLSGFVNLKKLKNLDLSSNGIANINFLSDLTNLEDLNLEWNRVSDISALSNLSNVKRIILRNNEISDINCLKGGKLLQNISNVIFIIAEGNSITREDEVLVFPEAYCNSQFFREGFDPTYVAYPDDAFRVLLEQNQKKDVIVKSDSDTLLTFAKGSMKDVSGKESYDFSNSIERDFSKLAKLPADITKENFALQITYGETGAFPAEAEVYLYAGKENVGKTASYGRLNASGTLEDVQEATVNKKGYITVKQDKGGTYILTVSSKDATLMGELESAGTGATVEAEFPAEEAVLSQEVLETMQDKDVNLNVNLDNGIAWSMNGKQLPETGLSDINLSVKKTAGNAGNLTESEISSLAGMRTAEQLVFNENGELGFAPQLTIDTKSQMQGEKAVLLQKTDASAAASKAGTEKKLQLADSALIKNQSVTFTVSRKADSAIIYGTNGDTDGDGTVKLTDMMQILHGVSGRKGLNEAQKGFADVDMNDKVDIQDLMRELHFVSGRSQSVYEAK